MRKIVLAAVMILCLSAIPLGEADADEGLNGYAENDKVSISYTEPLAYISFAAMPDGAFNISVFSTAHIQKSIYIPEPKRSLVIELEPLREQTYTFLFTYADGSELTSVNMDVGHFTYYTVTLSPGDGKGTEKSVEIPSGGSYVLPECMFDAPEGKQFTSWSVGGTSHSAGDVIKVTSDMKAVALWGDKSSDEGFPIGFVIVIVLALIIALIAVVIVLRRTR